MSALPDIHALATCPDDRLMKLWEGLGYYSRARNLKRAAMMIEFDFGGSLPRTAAELRRLPGIGDYTAGAIASIAFGEPEPAVDGNVLRVMTRLCGYEDDVMLLSTKRRVADELRAIYPIGNGATVLTEAIMELGETVCIPNGRAKCEECPLASYCTAHNTGRVDELPRKSAKKARKDLSLTVLLLFCEGKVALCQRPQEGLLAGLWELPNVEGHLSIEETMQYCHVLQVEPTECTPCGEATHIFTHLNWNMIGYRVACTYPSEAFVWVAPEKLVDTYALPTAFRYYRNQI
jgi:A/G-specific adenine glycosylase